MTSETAFIAAMRRIATHAGARGLLDDAAVLEVSGAQLVLTHDMIVEGLHYLADDPPGDVAWKLVAVNLSDLAAKGAKPAAVLLGYTLGTEEWDRAFAEGLATALAGFGIALLGGDTVTMPEGAPRAFGLTAIGIAEGPAPSRMGAKPDDALWVSGTIGDSGAGLKARTGAIEGAEELIARYRRPRPRIEAGIALAPYVNAMMDVSDGLLIDTARLCEASACSAAIELDRVPLSEPFLAAEGDGRDARLFAASAGDDYELLFAAPDEAAAAILALAEEIGVPFSRIGRIGAGAGLSLLDRGGAVPLPERLGYEHRS